MWIKICANTNLDDALYAAEAGADAVGFVFAASKRRVTPEQVAAITPRLPESVERIGVFTTLDEAEIRAAVERCGLTGVQLHSALDAGLIARLKSSAAGRVLKVVQVVDFAVDGGEAAGQQLAADLRAVLQAPSLDGVLLDAARGGISGGTGQVFPWRRAGEVLRQVWPRASAPQLIVAGGLRPENVAEAIASLRPDGVDVASGVEAAYGRKDHERVLAFIRNARAATDERKKL